MGQTHDASGHQLNIIYWDSENEFGSVTNNKPLKFYYNRVTELELDVENK